MRINVNDNTEASVPLSPLIDCVFLLLIFFLVTTMLKRWETQILVTLPEMTSTLSEEVEQDVLTIALGAEGEPYRTTEHDIYSGEINYEAIADLKAFLVALGEDGTDQQLEIAAHGDVPMDRVIEVFDMCQAYGFKRTRVRLGGLPDAD